MRHDIDNRKNIETTKVLYILPKFHGLWDLHFSRSVNSVFCLTARTRPTVVTATHTHRHKRVFDGISTPHRSNPFKRPTSGVNEVEHSVSLRTATVTFVVDNACGLTKKPKVYIV